MNKDCKIIQDLLPNYIEDLTSNESNNYIENHLKDCKDCTKVLKTMQEEFKVKVEAPKEEIDYMKKAKKKMRLRDRLALIILLLIIVLILVFWREAFSIICYSNICRKYLYWQDEVQKAGKYTVITMNNYKTYNYYIPGKTVTEICEIGKDEGWIKAYVEDNEFEGVDLVYSSADILDEKAVIGFYTEHSMEPSSYEEYYPYQSYFSFKEKLNYRTLMASFMDVRYITLSDDCYVIDLKYTDNKVYVDRKTGLVKKWGDIFYTINIGSINEEKMNFPDLDNDYIILEDYDLPSRNKNIPTSKISNCDEEIGKVVAYDFNIGLEENGSLQGFMKTDKDNIMIIKVKTLKTYKKLQEKWSGLRDLTEEDFKQYYVMIAVDKDSKKQIHYSDFIPPEVEYGNITINLTETESKDNFQYSASLMIVPNNMELTASGVTIFGYKVDVINN